VSTALGPSARCIDLLKLGVTLAAAGLCMLQCAPREQQRAAPTTASASISEERLSHSVDAAVGWFVNAQRTDGRFYYAYDVSHDHYEETQYNIVRHAGSLRSLCQAHARRPSATLHNTILGAAEWLIRQSRPASSSRGRVFVFGGKPKLGAEGLGLLALLECRRSVADNRWDGLISELKDYLVERIGDDGTMLADGAIVDKDEDSSADHSIYYPGEVVLSLIEYYDQFGRPPELVAAIDRALAAIERHNDGKEPVPEAWRVMAMVRWFELTGSRERLSYAARILASIARTQVQDPADAIMYGGFATRKGPKTIQAGSRNEAITAAWRIADRVGWDRSTFERIATAAARFELSQQYIDEDQANPIPRFDRAKGGFRNGPGDDRIRIDGVQHNLSALIGVMDILAAQPVAAVPSS
jgi:hypothetical protein